MIWAVLGCLAACAGAALLAPRLGRLMHPILATLLLGLVTVTATCAALFVVTVIAWTTLAQIPMVARAGDWSPELLAAADPVPRWMAVGCLVVAVRAVVVGLRTITAQASGLAAMRQALTGIRPAGALTLVDDPRRIAFATPAAGGRIVVSTGMLRALTVDERRVLLAHESAHVRYRHYWWVAATEVAAAMCPPLQATARGVAESAERWADEDAAIAVGDRTTVARALARAALHRSSTPLPRGAVAVARGPMVSRVEAMLEPSPRRRLIPASVLVALVVVSITTAWLVGEHTDTLFDQSAASTPHASIVDRSQNDRWPAQISRILGSPRPTNQCDRATICRSSRLIG